MVGFLGPNSSEGRITISALPFPPAISGTSQVDLAIKMFPERPETVIIEQFQPSIVGGREAVVGVIFNIDQNMFTKIALIKEGKDSLYSLQYLNLNDHFYREHRRTMNKLIATVSFKE